MEFGILGPLLVKDAAGTHPVPAPKQRILLAALLLHPDRPVPADRLADLLWDGRPPRSAGSTLRNYVMRLRQVLGPAGRRIETGAGGYLLRAAPDEVDLHRFAALHEQGLAALRNDAAPRAVGLLREALALWRGPALVDIPSDALHREEGGRLAATRLDVLELRIAAELRTGRYADALPELRELTAVHPERERLWLHLVTALERDGRPREALAAHRAARAALHHGLGVAPGARLRSAHQRLLAAAGPVTARHIPSSVADFTGRSAELRLLTEQLAGAAAAGGPARVLVLTGGPGVGKSALALRAAQQVRESFADGTLYAELGSPVDEGGANGSEEVVGRVLETLLGALAVPAAEVPAGTAARTALYRSVLADRQVLVVLDGARGTGQVLPLLPTGPGSAALVTSRERLADLPGARPLLLEPLSPPESHRLLVRLLGARRVAAEPAAAARLVAACDGLPLALRICAARLGARPAWSLGHLAVRLSAPDRVLEELRVGSLDVRRAYAESFGRLDPEAAAAFRGLGAPSRVATAVASGPPAAERTEAARPDARGTLPGEDVLERLVDAHLVISPAPGRYAVPRLSYAFARWLRLAEQRRPDREKPPGRPRAGG